MTGRGGSFGRIRLCGSPYFGKCRFERPTQSLDQVKQLLHHGFPASQLTYVTR